MINLDRLPNYWSAGAYKGLVAIFQALDQRIEDVEVGAGGGGAVEYITPSMTAEERVNAMQAGGRVHFVDTPHDFEGFSGSSIPLNSSLFMTGDGPEQTILTAGSAGASVGSQKFVINNNFVCRHMGFEFTRAMWGIKPALDFEIDLIEISDCRFLNAGGILFYDIDSGTPHVDGALGSVKILNNRTINTHSGVWMRLGGGAGFTSIPVRRFEAHGNQMFDLNRGGLCCYYDSPPTNGVYRFPNSVAIASNNTIDGQLPDSGSATGFGIAMGACATDIRIANHLSGIFKGVRVNVEANYSKAKYILWVSNVVQGGDQDQGAFAVKNDDDGQEGFSLLADNHIVSDNVPAGNTSMAAIWVQGQNVTLIGNKCHGNWNGGNVIRVQGGSTPGPAMNDITIKDNEIKIYDPPGVVVEIGVQRGIYVNSLGNVGRVNITDNRITVNGKSQSHHRAIHLLSGTVADRNITDPMIADNKLYWGPDAVATGTSRAIELDHPDVDSNIADPYILRNHVDGFGIGVSIVELGGPLSGRVHLRNNTMQDVTTPLVNPSSVVIEEGNSFPKATRTESGTDATPSVLGLAEITITYSGATALTALDDGVKDQRLLVKFGNANATVDFTGTTLKGNVGADRAMASGDAMLCQFDGTNWYCSVIDATA